MKVYFKIHGAQRSGTNYLKWLIENNFEKVRCLSQWLGSKHGLPILEQEFDWDLKSTWAQGSSPTPTNRDITRIRRAIGVGNFYYLSIIKNPFSWIISYKRYRKLEILETSHLEKFINKWNITYQGIVEFNKNKSNSLIIRYEDLLKSDSLSSILDIVSDFSKVPRTEFKNTPLVLQRGGDGLCKTHEDSFDKSYYLEHQYLKELSEEEIIYITKHVSRDFLKKCRYVNILETANEFQR